MAYLMTPAQHREQAERLREAKDLRARHLAQGHENVARLIEARLKADRDPSSPPGERPVEPAA